MLDVDAEIAAALKKVDRVIDRTIHHEARPRAQRARRKRERAREGAPMYHFAGQISPTEEANRVVINGVAYFGKHRSP